MIDRDFKTQPQIQELLSGLDIHVLQVHEIENFYLHPPVLQALLDKSERTEKPEDLILQCADRSSGTWITELVSALTAPCARFDGSVKL